MRISWYQGGAMPNSPKPYEQFIDELHVTDFEIPRAPFARLPHSTQRPDYKDIAPDQRDKAQRYYRQYYEQVLVLGQLVHEAAPQLRLLVVEQAYPQDPSWPDMDPAVDIWCPLWSFIDRDTIGRKLAQGDEVWSYTALVQRSPPYHPQYAQVKDKAPPYWHIDRPLLA